MNASAWQGAGRRIECHEVGTRDGLQSEAQFVETADKVALVDALSATGLAKIEVTAFVSAQAIPQLRDAEAVMHRIQRRPGVVYSALVPNARGAERALEAGAGALNLVMSASATHNLSNLRMTQAQSWSALRGIAALAAPTGVGLNVSLSCAFGCPMEGDVDEDQVLDWCARSLGELGAQGVTLCDTTGMAHPSQVLRLTEAYGRRFGADTLTLHFHNTRGMGLANVLAGIEAGARRFDTSLGGLGGCPYAPGATGNVCTEDVVHALDCMGYDTGVDLAGLLAASRRLPDLVGHDVPSQVLKAGRRLDLHPPPPGFEGLRARAAAR